MNKKPFILISNDDGFRAKGLNCLVDMLKDMADILVCAPETARSAFSRAITVKSPLRLKLRKDEEHLQIYSCNGTPVDCIKLALHQLCTERKPDLIIGGINHGDNASVNVHYSGTMGVAFEGCMKYIPSVAYSICDHSEDADFAPLTQYIRSITQKVLQEGLPLGVCLNVNFPLAQNFNGVKICRMAKGTWDKECAKFTHPIGFNYYWLTGWYKNDEPQAQDTDSWALENNYVAITPTTIDVTSYDMIERMKTWNL